MKAIKKFVILGPESTGKSTLCKSLAAHFQSAWCEEYAREYLFGECDFFILDTIVKKKYYGYLLCNIDLPWVKDELREYPDEKPRQELFAIYKDLLLNQPTPWALISGNNTERTQAAIKAINQFML